MKISTKGRYAMRMLLDLAERQNEGCDYVSIRDVAERQNISKKYLEQIAPLLNRSGVLQTSRGYRGGYRLAQAPENYTVGMILRLTEGSLVPVACVEPSASECPRAEDCLTLPVWRGLYQVINAYLDGITLQDILDQRRARGMQGRTL